MIFPQKMIRFKKIPVGQMVVWGGEFDNIPQGWLYCDGRSLSVRVYPELFKILGYNYGGSKGEFRLPDLRECSRKQKLSFWGKIKLFFSKKEITPHLITIDSTDFVNVRHLIKIL